MSTALQRVRAVINAKTSGRDVDPITERLGLVRPKEDVRQSLFNVGTYRWALALIAVFALYYGVIASDRYVTHVQVHVKSAGQGAGLSPTAALLNLPGGGAEDTQLVQDYIRSYDMLRLLDDRLDLKSHYSGQGDWLSKMEGNPTREAFLDYYRKRVQVASAIGSPVLDIEVQGFSPDFANRVAQEILTISEGFINKVSQDIARQDLAFATGEMERAKAEVKAVEVRIANFRRENRILDAAATSANLQGVVNALEAELSQSQATEKALSTYLKDGDVELAALRDKIAAIQAQIVEERSKISRTDSEDINAVALQFRGLELDLQFATDLYTTTLAALEKARAESNRKLKHLVVVQSPAPADEALYPRRLYSVATAALVITLVYGLLLLIYATIREHRDV